MYKTLRVSTHEGVAIVELYRPERLNAYTPEMGDEILAALEALRADTAVRAVVLAGAGRAFCAGVDLEELRASRAGEGRLGKEAFLSRFPGELVSFPKPTVAAIHGAAVGVGVTLTLGCDARIAARDASLSLPFVKLGLLPGLGSTHLLPRLVGPARARELILTGRAVGAEEAAAMGLVSAVVPAEELRERAQALATAMAQGAPEVVSAAKRLLGEAGATSLEAALEAERSESALLPGAGRAS